MKSGISRRDFLKLANLLPIGLSASQLSNTLGLRGTQEQKNVIVVVFDAFSAYNMSLHGYDRETTPNINRLAERAVVYHNHFAGSNFTTSGTATLLTGTLAWTHRALRPNGTVADEYVNKSIFSVFNDYYRICYSHNVWVNTLFNQFARDLDEWIPREQLCLFSSDAVIQSVFKNDMDISSVGWVRNTKIKDEGYAYSLFLSRLLTSIEENQIARYKQEFPLGLPTSKADNGFLLENAVDSITDRINSITQPILGYFHFLPPHAPYAPSRGFAGKFRHDGFYPVDKPLDVFTTVEVKDMQGRRASYDEYILYVDREFGRLFDILEESGVLEDTWLVLTSDHGEAFERGIRGHSTSALYQPLIRVPLLVFEPGRTSRQDIYEPTSAVDLLPTFTYLTGKGIPDWSEGKILPPFQQSDAVERGIYALRSYFAEKDAPLEQGSVTLVKGSYKLHYYFGYPELNLGELVKLFDVESDPEELMDLAELKPDITRYLLDELKAKLMDVNKPYLRE